MLLEEQVCTAEQGITLADLGVTAKSNYYWIYNKIIKMWHFDDRDLSIIGDIKSVPAYTVAELGLILNQAQDVEWESCHFFGFFICDLAGNNWNGAHPERTEAQARAAAVIWLIKNSYINPEELEL